ncbi:uncharacterized protein LOC135373262 isoform X2 [Ornithodoros turicata]|uniref:uncharacterized protein LOC135373262 isoform X2 n=1 Tax=Ornithodoros turicata TaxID=34597 RepID=UPI00313884AE
MTNTVDQMENLIQTASNQSAAAVTAAPMLDIGLGVCVYAGVLHRIERSCKGDRTRLAHALIWAVFSPEEMIGQTSYGRQCNAHKDAALKPAVDETRREAVLVPLAATTMF